METPEVTPGAPAPEVTPAAAAPAADPFDDNLVQQFDRSYVEKLRQENAGTRAKLRELEEAFNPYDDEERGIWRNLMATTATDPVKGAKAMQAIAEAILKGEVSPEEGAELAAEVQGQGQQPAGEQPKFLTQEDVDRMFEEKLAAREQSEREKAMKDDLIREAKELGYAPDTLEYTELVWLAVHTTGGDMKAAHELRELREQNIVDGFVQRQRDIAEGIVDRPSGGGAPANDAGAAKDMNEAKARLAARLSNL